MVSVCRLQTLRFYSENPEIKPWKRGAFAIGSAATGKCLLKNGGPLKGYLAKVLAKLQRELAKELVEKFSKEGIETIAG